MRLVGRGSGGEEESEETPYTLRPSAKTKYSISKEKELIGEELALANGKIKELEQALLTTNSKISQLEAKIRELENNSGSSEEFKKIKKGIDHWETKASAREE